MKNSQKKEIPELERFEHLLSARLDALERRDGTDREQIDTGTERLLIYFAFERIRKNEYLECVQCKGRIGENRLLANPTVLTCTNCEPAATER
jgi:RNA polymerase-binding transcription factor DksA